MNCEIISFLKVCFCSGTPRHTLSFQPYTWPKKKKNIPYWVTKKPPEKAKRTATGKKRRKYNKTSCREKLRYWLVSNKVTGIYQLTVDGRNEMVLFRQTFPTTIVLRLSKRSPLSPYGCGDIAIPTYSDIYFCTARRYTSNSVPRCNPSAIG